MPDRIETQPLRSLGRGSWVLGMTNEQHRANRARLNADIDAVARCLRLTGDKRAREIAYQALNGYVYQRARIVRAVGIVRAFRALGGDV